jgi:uncharacterized protein YjbJ (UPF0337 family)
MSAFELLGDADAAACEGGACLVPGPSGYADGVPTWRKEPTMGDGTADKLKGHAKEATGEVTGDKDLKNEGKVDRASGGVKDKVGDATDKVKDALK